MPTLVSTQKVGTPETKSTIKHRLHTLASLMVQLSFGVGGENDRTCFGPSNIDLHVSLRESRVDTFDFARTPEIVYPCIPDSDREDEGGQASSSLAVSTRWISAAKLLQSDLTTLAQREGVEYEVVAKVAAYQP
ncbi:hypothetical protein GW17_00022563 [Ensete ventricosum]|nr:hypothetical protein GW17_00022563 [Ensete ventricosum]RZS02354.1 hypothetical protein BHM03_00032400 [Ensete ventricosum]